MRTALFRPRVERLVVLYDADCGFCRWTARRLRRMDRGRRLDLRPLQSVEGGNLQLAPVAAHDLRASLHVVRDDGAVRGGGAAMLEILDALPGGRLLRPWTALPGAARLADVVYRAAARRRTWLGALVASTGGSVPACRLDAADLRGGQRGTRAGEGG